MILREVDGHTEILLHRRQGTGYMDGKWDVAASGHVDEGETATQAAARECAEELGIDASEHDMRFVHLSHRVGVGGGRTYYDIYFVVEQYKGTPRITEPDKCSELAWFAVAALPDDMIDIRAMAVRCYLSDALYSEVVEG